MNWMFVSSQNSYIENLTLNIKVLDDTYGRWLSLEGGALMKGIGTLIKEA